MTDYYAFQKLAINAHGHQVTIVGKPGAWSWDELDPGTAALLQVAEIDPDDDVLDLGCGTGAIGAVASILAPRGHITLVDCNIVATSCAQHTLITNDIANAEVQLADGVEMLAPASFDVVLSHLPRGRAVKEELIQGAARVLGPGGRFYFVANKRAGVKGAISYARALFGQCGVIRQKKGYHVALAIKPTDLELSPPVDSYIARTVILNDVETALVSKPGVFAWDRVDAGSAALVSAMEIEARDRVLDLGCGTGLAGLAAARSASEGHVVLADADARAVESARRTLEANGLTNAETLLSDCGSAVLDRQFDAGRFAKHRFDAVITNPPFHQGVGVDYDVACQFVRDAAQALRRGGRLFLVANRFLRYGDLIRETFGNVATAYADNRYHVLTAVAQKSSSG
ncbi:MAG: methyltransferase [Chloroflexi bacterium]|nr:methyltransferase [Chloroflexota bacterium]